MDDLELPFELEAMAVTVRRGAGGWVVEVRSKREASSWGLSERYERLTFDEALDVAFCSLGTWT